MDDADAEMGWFTLLKAVRSWIVNSSMCLPQPWVITVIPDRSELQSKRTHFVNIGVQLNLRVFMVTK